MPLTDFQREVLSLLAVNRSPASHLAGALVLQKSETSNRFSTDIDYFNDSNAIVADAYRKDMSLLQNNGYSVNLLLSQPGFIRTEIALGQDNLKVEWARDSIWRFMPIVEDKESGYSLHLYDSAINKLLALVGRDEVRDVVDIVYIHQNWIHFGHLIWAACGKDPGYTPQMILEMIRQRGHVRQEELSALCHTRWRFANHSLSLKS